MYSSLLAVLTVGLSSAFAAEIEVSTASAIQITIDARPVQFNQRGVATAQNLPAGEHIVEARDRSERVVARASVSLAKDDLVRFQFKNNKLVHLGNFKLGPATTVIVTEDAQLQNTKTTITSSLSGLTIVDGGTTLSIDAGFGGLNLQITDSDERSEVTVTESKPVKPKKPKAMADDSFRTLLTTVKGESFASDKLRVLKTAANGNHFTIRQLILVVNTFSFSTDKIQAVKLLHRTIIDPQNAHLLSKAFDFGSDKEEALGFFSGEQR